jgi:hypothetical protein
LIVARLLPAGAALTLAVDDTLFRRSGKNARLLLNHGRIHEDQSPTRIRTCIPGSLRRSRLGLQGLCVEGSDAVGQAALGQVVVAGHG